MLNFYREYSRVIGKLILNQFGAAFLAIMLGLAADELNSTLFLITSIFSVCFLLYLNYTVLWEEGAKSRIRVDSGREKYNSFTGLWIGLIASIPNILFGIITAVTCFLGSSNGPFAWEWAGNINAVVNILARLWQAMYLGIIAAIDAGNHYLLLLTPIPIILGAWASYWIGLKNRKMFGVFQKKTSSSGKRAGK